MSGGDSESAVLAAEGLDPQQRELQETVSDFARRELNAGLGFAVEVVEDVGPVDGNRVFVLEDDAHHAAEGGAAVRALRLGLLVVVLDPERSHAEPKGSRWDRGCELSTRSFRSPSP